MIKQQIRFSKNYPCCKNCKNLTAAFGRFYCSHYNTKGQPKIISGFTILMNYRFKPKSCKAFISKNKKGRV